MKRVIGLLLLTLFGSIASAQSYSNVGDYYTVAPDYRRCVYPLCGGWWLTKVNQYSVASGAVLDPSISPIAPNPIYVASIDYTALGLTQEQIYKYQSNIYLGRAFIRGVLKPYTGPGSTQYNLRSLAATGTWVAANDNAAYGPYLNVRSSGIVCITTPCPYYTVQVLNTNYSTPAHELNLTRADLTAKQTELAWREVDGRGLVMTGIRFESQGQTGTGLGIAATRVFFTFPGPLD